MSEIPNQLIPYNNGEWLTPNTYTSKIYSCLPKASGIYAIVKATLDEYYTLCKKEVMYVGMSQNIAQRHTGHEIKKMIESDMGEDQGPWLQVFFFECEDRLRDVEREIISGINPPYNIMGRTRGVSWDGLDYTATLWTTRKCKN